MSSWNDGQRFLRFWTPGAAKSLASSEKLSLYFIGRWDHCDSRKPPLGRLNQAYGHPSRLLTEVQIGTGEILRYCFVHHLNTTIHAILKFVSGPSGLLSYANGDLNRRPMMKDLWSMRVSENIYLDKDCLFRSQFPLDRHSVSRSRLPLERHPQSLSG